MHKRREYTHKKGAPCALLLREYRHPWMAWRICRRTIRIVLSYVAIPLVFAVLLCFFRYFGANSYSVFIFGYFFSCRSFFSSPSLWWVYAFLCVPCAMCLYACKSSWWLRLRWFWCWFILCSGYVLYGFCLANCIVKNLCVCVCGMERKRARIEMCMCGYYIIG